MIKIEIDVIGSGLVNNPPELIETIILGKLKDAGIPVKGLLRFDGLERGTLERADGDLGPIYTWHDEKEG